MLKGTQKRGERLRTPIKYRPAPSARKRESVSPSHGIGDDPKQAITPEVLAETIAQAKLLWAIRRRTKV